VHEGPCSSNAVTVRLTEQQRELLDAFAAELGSTVEDALRYGFDAFLREQR
jgi:hypothetical protein